MTLVLEHLHVLDLLDCAAVSALRGGQGGGHTEAEDNGEILHIVFEDAA